MAVDICEGGLRVRREATARLPLQLSIYDQSDRTFRPAAVAWAHGALVGMRFMGPPVKATPPEIEQLTRRADTKSIYLHK
ncbi:hypothetical protein [Aurantimonas marianensis]|uniref:PilZ domain-containing protein n=1 Tax=Aurantimonas marianensis TaxID=2920428 RepID=A0A9X2KFP2_9HYPH|nr:hypothetical protein [Aurantimonas marianensis]MCP3056004.1 hypothetical protein [Aurantimonas marianensis]